MNQKKPVTPHVCWVAFTPEQLEIVAHFMRSTITSDLRFDRDRDNHDTGQVLKAWRRERIGFVGDHAEMFGRGHAADLKIQHDEDARLLRLIDAAQRVKAVAS